AVVEIPRPLASNVAVDGQLVAVLAGIGRECDPDLVQVAGALSSNGSQFRLARGWQEHCRQDGNNRDHHQGCCKEAILHLRRKLVETFVEKRPDPTKLSTKFATKLLSRLGQRKKENNLFRRS